MYALGNVLELSKASIVYINNQYVREGELDVHQLFTSEDITEQVVANQAYVEQNLLNMESMLDGEMPEPAWNAALHR